jgi:hypothetical protein
VTEEVVPVLLDRIRLARAADAENEELRATEAILRAQHDAFRSESGRMTAPAEREYAQRRELRLDGTWVDLPESKTPLEIVESGEDRKLLDPEGNALVRRVRTVDTLAALLKSGDINLDGLKAGRRFHRLFLMANLNPLRASTIGDTRGGRSEDLPTRVLRAQHAVSEAIKLLGGHRAPAAGVVWAVVGEERSLTEYAAMTAWGASGRSLKVPVALGHLSSALAILAVNWCDASDSGDQIVHDGGEAPGSAWGVTARIRDCVARGEIGAHQADRLCDTVLGRTAARR